MLKSISVTCYKVNAQHCLGLKLITHVNLLIRVELIICVYKLTL